MAHTPDEPGGGHGERSAVPESLDGDPARGILLGVLISVLFVWLPALLIGRALRRALSAERRSGAATPGR